VWAYLKIGNKSRENHLKIRAEFFSWSYGVMRYLVLRVPKSALRVKSERIEKAQLVTRNFKV
jgi:hypothetical protein